MDACSKPALQTVLADHELPAFRMVMDSFGPIGYDMNLDHLFEVGLGYLLEGFRSPK
jgi:hypothetical protein